ncbi:Hint domain-containing protein [Shimia sagamensis]|uniref:Ca2+-binding protein, RTX toxin-related n=1 Tax=Shimia sagamensis TaxID=1566352 RepID=A0ABY1PCR1_9RHOB|nr:Hint domain-containing protein [Shimia sagamensis]SMP30964.1 Ca2+-binding protein, RTX toxin-related [Shimia sagamensis]
MTTYTGYLVSLDVGSNGLGTSDEIDGSLGENTIFTQQDMPIGSGSVTFPALGTVTGTFYAQSGQAYFVPDDSEVDPGDSLGYIDTFSDVINGSSGDDNIWVWADSDDVIHDTDGDIYDASGDDIIYAGSGDDSVVFGDGNDSIYGESGNDQIGLWTTGSGDNRLDGGAGNDTIIGGDGNDNIIGGDGDDVLYGASGADTFSGGAGSDEFWITDDHDYALIDGGNDASGWDLVGFSNWESTQGVDVTFSGDKAGTFDFGGTTTHGSFTEIEHIVGTNYADSIDASADSTNLTLEGFDGDDSITGSTGNNYIYGGAGDDTITGGGGDDKLFGGDGNDVFNVHAVVQPEELDDDDFEVGGLEVGGFDLSGFGEVEPAIAEIPSIDVYDEPLEDDAADDEPDDELELGDDDEIDDEEADDGTNDIVHVDGGGWWDTLSFHEGTSTSGVTVTYTGNSEGNFGLEGVDGTFTSIEALRTTENADFIDGSVSFESALMVTGDGNDTVIGTHGDDEIWAGGDNDLINASSGDDTIGGGAGSDTITGGTGSDSFVIEDNDGFDVITDFTMDDRQTDQLDVSELTNEDGEPVQVSDVDVSSDNIGNAILSFPNGEAVKLQGIQASSINNSTLIEMGIPCFTAGVMIATPNGEVPIDHLHVGDLVQTLDHGPQPIVWIGKRHLGLAELIAFPKLRPVFIREGALGNSRDMLVSPQHGMVTTQGGDTPQLARAIHLARNGGPGFRIALGVQEVTYYHLMLERHEIIMADGAPTESFYPGPMAMGSLRTDERREITHLFPELLTLPGVSAYGPTARGFLKSRELSRDTAALFEPVRALT